jgi:hypothetical protein
MTLGEIHDALHQLTQAEKAVAAVEQYMRTMGAPMEERLAANKAEVARLRAIQIDTGENE